MKKQQHTILTPDKGKMLYNGQVYSDRVYVGVADNPDNWQEVPLAQYEQWLAEQESQHAADLAAPDPETVPEAGLSAGETPN